MKPDIDIFVKFNNQTSLEDFENYGKEIGLQSLKNFSPYLRYADHPYVEAYVEAVKINVVPCFDVEYGRWKSALYDLHFIQFMLYIILMIIKKTKLGY